MYLEGVTFPLTVSQVINVKNNFRICLKILADGMMQFRFVLQLVDKINIAWIRFQVRGNRSPWFDGLERHTIEGNDVVDLEISALNVTNISPLSALRKLRGFVCVASTDGSKRSTLSDISPLRGLPLGKLRIPATDVSDLSPVAGMPLNHLGIGHTRITDLSPLKGAPLDTLMAQGVPLRDLSPLRGMPLKTIWCDKAVTATPANQEILKSIPTLKTIQTGK